MNKQQFMKKAEKMNVQVEIRDTTGTWAVTMYDKGVINPGKVNVARLSIPHTKDLFWDACYGALVTHFNFEL